MKIAIIGMGFVGMSNAILLAQKNEVVAVDVDQVRVDKVNSKQPTVSDEGMSHFLANENLNLSATLSLRDGVQGAEYAVVCTPTNYDPDTGSFDTATVEMVVKQALEVNPDVTVVIKSTVPIGYTLSLREKLGSDNILFSPEFLREGSALKDNLYPSRVIVGGDSDRAKKFAELLADGAIKKDVRKLFVGSTEAESVKLFSNSYLAMRVAYFNEVDTYCELKGLDASQVIDGMGFDSRIGEHYNNPSFGYGGYCFPKDTKQLLANYKDVPNSVVSAIVESNAKRKKHISQRIISSDVSAVGIYRLAMKTGSDNFRDAAILDIINDLKEAGIDVVVYEPLLSQANFMDCRVINDLEEFSNAVNIIVANRVDKVLDSVNKEIYSRDVYNNN